MIASYVIPIAVVDPQSYRYFVSQMGIPEEPIVEIINIKEKTHERRKQEDSSRD